jgi:peroxiredoxin Q/BCP
MTEINQEAPEIRLPADDGSEFVLSELRGQRVLLVFYPGDNTPVCTRQLCEYRDGIESFAGLGVTVVGISSNGLESHRKFREKHDLPFLLLADEALEVADRYGCKGLLGMKRAVFLVDEGGIIRYVHVEALALFRRSAEELLSVIRGLDQTGA